METLPEDHASYDLYADLAADVGVIVETCAGGDKQVNAVDGLVAGPLESSPESPSPVPLTSGSASEAQLRQAQAEIAQLQAELKHKDSKLKACIRQNGVLLRNLSLLFVTAQAEISKLKKETICGQVQVDGAHGTPRPAPVTPLGAPAPIINGNPRVGITRKEVPMDSAATFPPESKKQRVQATSNPC